MSKDNSDHSESAGISRRRIIGGLGAGTAALLAGCGGTTKTTKSGGDETTTKSGGDETTTKSGGDETTTKSGGDEMKVGSANIELTGWQASNEEQALLREMMDRFEKEYPKIQVDYNVIQGKYKQKLKTQLGAGNAADVFYVDSKYFPSFASAGVLMNLSPHIKDDEDFSTEPFFDSLIGAFTHNGKVMGIPKGFSPLGFFYNTEYFDEAGVSVPKTWDDWRNALTKIKEKTNVKYPLIAYPNIRMFKALLYQNGGRILSKDGSECVLASDANIETLNFIIDMRKDGLIATPSQIGAGWHGKALRTEKVANAILGVWGLPYIEKKPKVNKKIDVAHLPTPSDGEKATIAYTVSYSATANSDNPDAAYLLISELTSKEGAKAWAKKGLEVTSRKDLADIDYYKNHPRRKTMLEAGEWAQVAQWGQHSSAINTRLQAELEAAMLQEKTPQQALESAEQKINSDIL